MKIKNTSLLEAQRTSLFI